MPDNLIFPDNFLWGVGTRATSSDLLDSSTMTQILDLVAEPLAGKIHKVTLDWNRMEPREGEFDENETRSLKRFLEALRERGLKVMLVIQGPSLPTWIQNQGGWGTVQTLNFFDRFVGYAVSSFRGLVDYWCTLDDPMSLAGMPSSYETRPSLRRKWICLANLLAGHGRAYRILHRKSPACRVGLSHTISPADPLRPHGALDRWAASRADRLYNGGVLLALSRGLLACPWGQISVPEARGTLDYLGLNYRTRKFWTLNLSRPWSGFLSEVIPTGLPRCDEGLEIYPQGLARALHQAWSLRKPILIMQNGLADKDDKMRPTYLVAHLAGLHRALEQGIHVLGYIHGNLLSESNGHEGSAAHEGMAVQADGSDRMVLHHSGELFGDICRDNCVPGIWLRQFGIPLFLQE